MFFSSNRLPTAPGRHAPRPMVGRPAHAPVAPLQRRYRRAVTAAVALAGHYRYRPTHWHPCRWAAAVGKPVRPVVPCSGGGAALRYYANRPGLAGWPTKPYRGRP